MICSGKGWMSWSIRGIRWYNSRSTSTGQCSSSNGFFPIVSWPSGDCTPSSGWISAPATHLCSIGRRSGVEMGGESLLAIFYGETWFQHQPPIDFQLTDLLTTADWQRRHGMVVGSDYQAPHRPK